MSEILLSQTEYAAHRGVSQQRISALVGQGKIPPSCIKKVGKYKKIDRDKADAALAESLDRIYNKPGLRPDGKESKARAKKTDKAEVNAKIEKAGVKGLSLADAQKVQAQYKAALMKLEYDEKSGLLVRAEKVNTDFFNIARLVRDAILNVPDRVSAEIASNNDQRSVHNILTKELIQALEELST